MSPLLLDFGTEDRQDNRSFHPFDANYLESKDDLADKLRHVGTAPMAHSHVRDFLDE